MATIIQRPTSMGRHSYSTDPTLQSSYTDLVTLDPALSYPEHEDSKRPYIHSEYENPYTPSLVSTAPSSPLYTHSMGSRNSYFSTPTSYSSLDINEEYNEKDEYSFPSFGNNTPTSSYPHEHDISHVEDNATGSQAASTPPSEDFSISETVNDDQAIEHEPTQHVDYLSHEWKEEDIWSSWRYIVARRKTINNSVRLENASWRTWTKTKNSLRTVSPESLNWLKDCDVTWLYGPLQTEMSKSLSRCQSPPPSQLSRTSSFVNKKTCLKKKSASAVILERSRSQQTLLQRAGDIIRVQQSSPIPRYRPLRRGGSDFSLPSYGNSSVSNTPADSAAWSDHHYKNSLGAQTPVESKHVFFNEEVRQVRAIESDDDDKEVRPEEEDEDDDYESDEDDDGGLIMMPTRSRSNRSTPSGSFSEGNRTITPLPSTTLKYRKDTPEPPEIKGNPGLWAPSQKLSHSSSQETLKPSQSHNFLLDDDPELNDDPWPGQVQSYSGYSPYAREDQDESSPQMRRTPSGMFMPYDENEEEAATNDTLIGQAVYAFNTFKDIAHVVWNVGWNRGR